MVMTNLLEKAFSEASRLPAAAQNLIAQRLLDDLTVEGKWNDALADSQDELSILAGEALTDFQAGRTRPLEEVL